jgi:CheY-like chemotaxis protein
LKDVYPEWLPDAAGSVDDATALIDEAVERGSPYDVVILDLHLPKKQGFMPAPSLHLTEYAFRQLPEALIIQVTAYEDDRDLKEKLLTPKLQDPDRRLLFLPKREGYPLQIASLAIQRVLGDPIEDQLDDMFGSDQTLHSGRRSRSSSHETGLSLTHRMADLRGRISTSWKYLSPELQGRIRRNFKVDDTVTPVRITMF